jgi:PHD/YefM family antitoxin component YafN of YafNO toxin-antitoxin module
MEIAYTQQETVGITELSKSLGIYVDKLISYPLNKLAIIRRNKMEAVIVPIAEYERMKIAADYLEDMEIEKMVKERMAGNPKMITEEEMDKYFEQRGLNV